MNKFLKVLVVLVIILFLVWLVISILNRFSDNHMTADDVVSSAQQDVSVGAISAPSVVEDDTNFVESTLDLSDAARSIKKEYTEDPEFRLCAHEIVSTCLTTAINKRVLELGDLSICDDFLTDQTRESCRITQSNQLARERGDVSYCNNLSEVQQLNCRSEVAAVKAVATKNIAECDALGEQRELCVDAAAQRLAYNTLDASWCENLSEGQRTFCVQDIEAQIKESQEQERIEADFAREQEVERQRLEQENAAANIPEISAPAGESDRSETVEELTVPKGV